MTASHLHLLIGATLLFLGRRLFWFYVGAVGFVIGFDAAKTFFHDQSDVAILGTAAVAGVLGVVLALFFQKIAVASAGFLTGGYVALTLTTRMMWLPADQLWLAFPVGGLIGGLLALWLFDLAMIL